MLVVLSAVVLRFESLDVNLCRSKSAGGMINIKIKFCVELSSLKDSTVKVLEERNII